MPRTRSSIARAAPKPHKLPTDILTRVAAYACDDELARLALSAKSALAALDNQQIWAATLRTNHGGLVIRAEPSGLQAAARLAEGSWKVTLSSTRGTKRLLAEPKGHTLVGYHCFGDSPKYENCSDAEDIPGQLDGDRFVIRQWLSLIHI